MFIWIRDLRLLIGSEKVEALWWTIYNLKLWITQLSAMDETACLVTSLIQQLFQHIGYAHVWRYASVILISYFCLCFLKWQAPFHFLHLKFCKGGLLTRSWKPSYLLSFALSHPITRIWKVPFLYLTFTIWKERKLSAEELVLRFRR